MAMANETTKLERAAHAMAWLGGIFIALTPFVWKWSIQIGSDPFPVRVAEGNPLVELIVAGLLVAVGGTFGGFWGEKRRVGCPVALGLLGWGGCGLVGWLAQPAYWLGMALFAGVAAVSGVAALGAVWNRWRTRTRAPGVERGPWNGVLCGLVLVLAVASDCIMLEQARGGVSGVWGFVLARALTQVVLVSVMWFGLMQFGHWSPPGTRWLGGVAVGIAMVALGAEIGIRMLWGKGLVLVFGDLTVGGKFDLPHVLEGAGIRISPPVCLAAAGVVLLVGGVVFGSALLSRRMGLRLRPASLVWVAVGAWLLLLAEQGSEAFWNGRVGRWWQRRSCMIHLCPGIAAPRLASYTVVFREPPQPKSLTVTRRPDVYLFIVETLRGDGARPEVMPFVCKWRDSECQPIRETRSASNATHLSWFAMLSGRPSVFWEKDRQARRPAPLLDALHGGGYRTEVRSTASFNYAEMDTTNFGHGEATDVLLSLTSASVKWPAGISERDEHLFGLWREAVVERPAGGTFRLEAIESPHYPYNWAADFTPPFADFAKSDWFPLHPSAQDIERVRHRYWNSLAWVDRLLEKYITFLKEQGRYDDAMIIVTGDHGEELQEHGVWFHTSGLTIEETVVPVIVKWPKLLGRGEPLAMASHLDIMPSILDALGCPQSEWSGLAGRSLRQGGEPTVLVMSHYGSQNGEGMLWRRNGYEAAFGWDKIWVPRQPEHLWLARITGPHGDLDFDTPAAATAALREYFPDAIERWFRKFE